MKTMKVLEINQNKLSAECWSVQFSGLEVCEKCGYLNTDECGGKTIRASLVNIKGYKIPIGVRIK